MFEIYEHLLSTRLYAIHKTRASPTSDPTCRLCSTAQERMVHVLSECSALAQIKYLAKHDAVLKVLIFDIIEDLGLIEASPPWSSPTRPQPVYEGAHAQAYWEVPVYEEYQDLRANRIDARIVNHQEKKIIAIEMSCPRVSNRQKKTTEKTMKYAPLPRVRDFTVQHHCVRTRGLVDRRVGKRASWEASQRRPQEDAEVLPIRHTEHCTYF